MKGKKIFIIFAFVQTFLFLIVMIGFYHSILKFDTSYVEGNIIITLSIIYSILFVASLVCGLILFKSKNKSEEVLNQCDVSKYIVEECKKDQAFKEYICKQINYECMKKEKKE